MASEVAPVSLVSLDPTAGQAHEVSPDPADPRDQVENLATLASKEHPDRRDDVVTKEKEVNLEQMDHPER